MGGEVERESVRVEDVVERESVRVEGGVERRSVKVEGGVERELVRVEGGVERVSVRVEGGVERVSVRVEDEVERELVRGGVEVERGSVGVGDDGLVGVDRTTNEVTEGSVEGIGGEGSLRGSVSSFPSPSLSATDELMSSRMCLIKLSMPILRTFRERGACTASTKLVTPR